MTETHLARMTMKAWGDPVRESLEGEMTYELKAGDVLHVHPGLLESRARAHWWHRARQTTHAEQALHVCLGAADPQAQLAADEINQAWDNVKSIETEAMRAALDHFTLDMPRDATPV